MNKQIEKLIKEYENKIVLCNKIIANEFCSGVRNTEQIIIFNTKRDTYVSFVTGLKTLLVDK